jgi:hypothetical protein
VRPTGRGAFAFSGAKPEKEIRNPKLEIRNKLEGSKRENRKKGRAKIPDLFHHSNFGFVSDFEIRISNFKTKISRFEFSSDSGVELPAVPPC